MRCDLHTHTIHSDGSYTPVELAREASEKNLIIALTDHNTVTGLPEFLKEAESLDLTAIGGTELSTVYGGREFHLIGLFIEPEYYDRVDSLCTEYMILKEISNIELCEKLNERGYNIDYAAVKARNLKGNANRAHVAAELVKGGYVSSTKEAFEKLLDEKIGLYVPPKRLELVEGVRFLKEIGALPIIAHPLKDATPEQLREMLPILIDEGLVAIETMHSSYSNEDIAIARQIASDFGILESGGSDFHGSFKPGIMLGVGKGNLDIPVDVYNKLLEKKK